MRDGEALIHEEITREIIGVMFELHNRIGDGFLERVYANGMDLLLRRRGLSVEREQNYNILLDGDLIGSYRADLVVESKVIVEVKTGRFIDPAHLAQLRNYMRASGIVVGLLCNFGVAAEFRRLVDTRGLIVVATSSHTASSPSAPPPPRR